MEEGFFSFLPLLLGLLLALMVMWQMGDDDEVDRRAKPRSLTLAVLAGALVALSWSLIVPAVATAFAIAALRPTGFGWRTSLLGLGRESLRQLPIVALVVTAILMQTQVTASGVSLLDAIVAPGGIAILPGTLFLVVTAGVVACGGGPRPVEARSATRWC